MNSHTQGATEPPLLESTIPARMAETVARYPDQDALVVCHQGIRWTWKELDHQVMRVARGLLALGFQKGDRIGIWSPNHSEWVLTQLATARIGVVLVCLNPAYRTHEVRYALQQPGCRGLVASRAFKSSDYVAMVAEVRHELPALEHVIFLEDEGAKPPVDSIDWSTLLERGQPVPTAAVDAMTASLSNGEPINIQYTSGTTGFPKGATLSHRNILNNGYFVGLGCGYTHDDRICIPVPFYHCFGMVMGNLAAVALGATMVIPAPSFDPSATLRAVAEERCTSLYGVPTMFIAELADGAFEGADLSSLRTGIMAGSPCPVEVMRRCIDRMHMADVTICYGMTETSPVSTQTSVDDPIEKRVSTVGRVHPHVEVRIVDPETGAIVPRGTSGELCTRGYSVMLGYWQDPERTARAIDEEGWMHTGDLAVMDDDGYVDIVGRIKDMVIRGGENVYPREVEAFLYTHPRVQDVQVVGVPDDRYGEELMAWIQTTDGQTIEVAEIHAFCRGQIAHFKVPRYVGTIDAYPMTVTGKIQKFRLREMAIDQLGLKS